MFDLNMHKKKNNWFKQYKNMVLNINKSYYKEKLCEIYNLDSNIDLFCLTFYDCVNNNELNRFIKKLYKFKNNKKYNIDIIYRKKTIKNLNYIRPEFDSNGHAIIAKIKLLDDDLISTIDIVWGQVNNDEGVIEYTCLLKKPIKLFSDIHNYLVDNYNLLKKIKYSNFYYNIDFFMNDENDNIEIEYNYFITLVQNKIGRFATSHYINKYMLPLKQTYIIDKKTKKINQFLKKPDFKYTYMFDKNHYILVSKIDDFKGTQYDELIIKQTFNPISFISLLSTIRMPFYYEMFYHIEKAELQRKITKYLNSKRRFIYFCNYKWLLNKYRQIDEKRFYKTDTNKYVNKCSYSNEKEKFIDLNMYEGIKAVYKDNIEFIKNINIINYNIVALIISIIALIIAFTTFTVTVVSKNNNSYSCCNHNDVKCSHILNS